MKFRIFNARSTYSRAKVFFEFLKQNSMQLQTWKLLGTSVHSLFSNSGTINLFLAALGNDKFSQQPVWKRFARHFQSTIGPDFERSMGVQLPAPRMQYHAPLPRLRRFARFANLAGLSFDASLHASHTLNISFPPLLSITVVCQSR